MICIHYVMCHRMVINSPVLSIVVVCFSIAAAACAEGLPIAAPGAKVLLEFSLRFGPGKGHSVGLDRCG